MHSIRGLKILLSLSSVLFLAATMVHPAAYAAPLPELYQNSKISRTDKNTIQQTGTYAAAAAVSLIRPSDTGNRILSSIEHSIALVPFSSLNLQSGRNFNHTEIFSGYKNIRRNKYIDSIRDFQTLK